MLEYIFSLGAFGIALVSAFYCARRLKSVEKIVMYNTLEQDRNYLQNQKRFEEIPSRRGRPPVKDNSMDNIIETTEKLLVQLRLLKDSDN